MNPREPETEQENIIAIYLIVNGSVEMSAGKIASQAFQAAQRLLRAAENGEANDEQRALLRQWEQQGTRTICKIAETEAIFERACAEIPGLTLIDEGVFGCEPDTATVHASWPLRRGELPRMLRHKRVRLLLEPVIGAADERSLRVGSLRDGRLRLVA